MNILFDILWGMGMKEFGNERIWHGLNILVEQINLCNNGPLSSEGIILLIYLDL
jgi:hypothetical protein